MNNLTKEEILEWYKKERILCKKERVLYDFKLKPSKLTDSFYYIYLYYYLTSDQFTIEIINKGIVEDILIYTYSEINNLIKDYNNL